MAFEGAVDMARHVQLSAPGFSESIGYELPDIPPGSRRHFLEALGKPAVRLTRLWRQQPVPGDQAGVGIGQGLVNSATDPASVLRSADSTRGALDSFDRPWYDGCRR